MLAFVAAGCGGQSEEEKWASSVCSDLGDWKSQVTQATNDIASEVQSPGAGTLAAIETNVRKAVNATSQLASDLRALGAPDTESGAQAKQQLDSLVSELEGTANQAKQTVQSAKGSGLTQMVQALTPLASELQSLGTKVSSTLTSIQQTSTKLKDGFQKADSCKQFR